MNKNGIALIMAVGVLALLAIIATSFALNMRLEYHAAMNYYSGVKARYFAEAALQRAIAELRTHVKISAFDDTTEAWSLAGYSNNSMLIADKSAGRINSSGTSATTHVYDEQSKININTANTLLLGNLVSRVFPSWSNGAVNTFVTKITGHVPCNNLNELIMNVPSGGNNHIEKTDLDTLRPFITVNSYRDPNCGNRAPININTCSQAALESIFEGLRGATGAAISANRAADIASAVIGMRPITCWTRFGDTIDTVTTITTAQSAAIKDNCNPNRTKPAPFTTEFCFNSGGYYTVTAAGSVTGALSAPIASNTLSAVVKIYDIYCETTKAQFEKGAPCRVTWLDSCPVRSDQVFGTYDAIPTGYEKIKNSIKLGFWDDFSDATYSNTKWTYAGLTGITANQLFLDNFEMALLTKDAGFSTWTNYSISLFEEDQNDPSTQMRDCGWIFVKGSGAGCPAVLHTGPAAGNKGLEWGGVWAYRKASDPLGDVTFESAADAVLHGRTLYPYPPQIRIFRAQQAGNVENYDKLAYRTLLGYDKKKRYNIRVGARLVIGVYTSLGPSGSFLINDDTSNQGFSVYSAGNRSYWDDIRLISLDGNFTSQVINSTLSSGMPVTGNVEWGTITGTVTVPGLLTIPTTTIAGSETVTFQTSSDNDKYPSGVKEWKTTSVTSGQIFSSAGNSIQYKASLATASSGINETPVLEDITITYLPKVSIKSFSVSQ